LNIIKKERDKKKGGMKKKQKFDAGLMMEKW